MKESQSWDQVLTTFKKIWGYDNFRTPQGEIVKTILEKKDALIVMPTGGGKSLCFQLPALLEDGLTLVISPLVALMENQVQDLQKRKLAAASLHNELPRETRKQTLQLIEQQKLRLLYLSPETLLSSPVWERLTQKEIKINGLILDEAHCLVQWGETFRPSYRRLGVVREALLKTKPPETKIAIAAFTATADPQSQKIITETLNLKNPDLFLISPYRPNLNLKVEIVWTPRGRKQKMLNFITARKNQSGLVYVRSRQDSEKLSQWFNQQNYQTAAYHAGLSASQRRKIENQWLNNDLKFVICTNAFGMGIDKSNVRWIVHFHAPQLLAEYIQEVGRGGRDGKQTDTLTLISEPTGIFNPEDRNRNQFFLENTQKQYQKAENIIKKIPPQGNIDLISQQYQGGDITLAILHRMGKITWLDPFSYQINLNKSAISLPELIKQQREINHQMTDYLTTKECRWQFLLKAFGFPEEAKGLKCGNCDHCR
jgi:ATP-dependent DNA helicase RecQ